MSSITIAYDIDGYHTAGNVVAIGSCRKRNWNPWGYLNICCISCRCRVVGETVVHEFSGSVDITVGLLEESYGERKMKTFIIYNPLTYACTCKRVAKAGRVLLYSTHISVWLFGPKTRNEAEDTVGYAARASALASMMYTRRSTWISVDCNIH